MPIDGKKLGAWVNAGSGAAPPRPAKKGAAPPPPPMDEEESEAEAETEEESGGEMSEGGPMRFAPVMELLEDAAPQIEDAIASMDLAALLDMDTPLDEEQSALLMQTLSELDDALVEGMRDVLTEGDPLTSDEALELGAHLASEGKVEDGDVVGAWLWHAANHIAAQKP